MGALYVGAIIVVTFLTISATVYCLPKKAKAGIIKWMDNDE